MSERSFAENSQLIIGELEMGIQVMERIKQMQYPLEPIESSGEKYSDLVVIGSGEGSF